MHHYSPSPLLWSISSNFLMLSSRAWRVCFCVSIRVSNSYKKGKESIQGALPYFCWDAVKLCKLEKLVVRIPVRCTFSADTVSANIIFLLILRWWWQCWSLHNRFLKKKNSAFLKENVLSFSFDVTHWKSWILEYGTIQFSLTASMKYTFYFLRKWKSRISFISSKDRLDSNTFLGYWGNLRGAYLDGLFEDGHFSR